MINEMISISHFWAVMYLAPLVTIVRFARARVNVIDQRVF